MLALIYQVPEELGVYFFVFDGRRLQTSANMEEKLSISLVYTSLVLALAYGTGLRGTGIISQFWASCAKLAFSPRSNAMFPRLLGTKYPDTTVITTAAPLTFIPIILPTHRINASYLRC